MTKSDYILLHRNSEMSGCKFKCNEMGRQEDLLLPEGFSNPKHSFKIYAFFLQFPIFPIAFASIGAVGSGSEGARSGEPKRTTPTAAQRPCRPTTRRTDSLTPRTNADATGDDDDGGGGDKQVYLTTVSPSSVCQIFVRKRLKYIHKLTLCGKV